MSAFETNPETQTTETQTQERKNYLEELVGEGKKFKDAESLARGKAESDQYISNLERQLAEMRQDLSKADKVEELLELVRSQQSQSPSTPSSTGKESGSEEGSGNPNDTSSDLTEERLQELIQSHLSEREQTNRRSQNLAEVDQALEETYGEKAGQFVKDKAAEVGFTVDELKDLAAKNPKAFYKLTGVNQGTQRNPSTIVGSSRSAESEAGAKGQPRRNSKYYQDLRRSDKKRYYSPEVQHQMFLDAKEQGNAFYDE